MKTYLADQIRAGLRAGLSPTITEQNEALRTTEITPEEAQFAQEAWNKVNKPGLLTSELRTELSSDEWLRLDALDRAINLLQERCQSFTNPDWNPILRCAEDFYRFLSQ